MTYGGRSTGSAEVRGRSPRMTALLAILLGAIALACAPGASAIVFHEPAGPTVSYTAVPGAPAPPSPFDLVLHNLDYNGGPVMTSNTNYAFYWAPGGSSSYPADYQPGINRYFEDLAAESASHTNVDSVAAQYNNAAGEYASYNSHFAGVIIDTNPYPPNGCGYASICLTDAQIRTELTNYVKAHNLPSDLTHEYFVLTPPGVESCLEAAVCSGGSLHPSYCAYHGAVNLTGGAGVIVYSDDPYVGGTVCDSANHPNGTTSDATLLGGLSHEHIESLTDPEPNNAWTDWAGGPLGYGYEIGDKCRTFYEPTEYGPTLGIAPNGAKYNQVINGHYYWYQQEWSNQGHSCVQRFTFKGETPKATFTYSTNATNPELTTFNATGSTAPGGVAYYEWQLNATATGSTPIETTTPTLTYEFPKTGLFTVALTVFAADGTSIGTSQVVNISEPPEPKITSVAPKRGPLAGGTAVTITGTGFRNVTGVKFGTVAASGYTVNSETSITATSPGGTGTVDIGVTNSSGKSEPGASDQFVYAPFPTVTSLAPSSGPEAGGTSVTVSGTAFTGATSVKFGATPAGSFKVNSATSITAVAPAGTGVADVTVTTPEGTSVTSAADRFKYTAIPLVASISPGSGHEVGGTSVTVTGANLTGATAVRFGASAAAGFTVNSSTSITAVAPAGSGTVDVTVTTPEGTSATGPGDLFTYLPSPKVGSLSPTGGPEAGGTAVTITGTDLTGATAVTFGSTPATGDVVNSPTSVTAISPPGTGTVDVTLTTPNGTSATGAGDRFSYMAEAPTVSSISPSSGPEPGGTTVTITGTNLTGATAVDFGLTPSAGVTVNSSTSITAVAPAGTGTVDVTVTTSGGTSLTSFADQFTYEAPPVITGVSPQSGPEEGGTTVTITGTGLQGTYMVAFGAWSSSNFHVNSPTSITAVAPPQGVGTVDVWVANAVGVSTNTTADHYTYLSRPVLTKIAPAKGPATGGTTITITGSNLIGTTAVNFGSRPAASFHVNSPTSITAVSPAGTAGGVNITVTGENDGTSVISAHGTFKYGKPTVTAISPAAGPRAGGTNVSVSGSGFAVGAGATRFKVGKTAATGVVCPTTSECTLTTPAAKTAGTTDIIGSVGTLASAKNAADRFSYN